MSTLGTIAIASGTVQLPAWGVGWADLELAEAETLSGAVTLSSGDRTWQCTVVSGGPYLNRARYRVAIGSGTWGQVLPEKSYANDAGVKTSKVIDDAARACGASIAAPPAERLGAHYVRVKAPASRALTKTIGNDWYVDDAGVTQFSARPAGTYDGDATLVRYDEAAAIAEYHTTSLAGFNPGVSFGGLTASDVEISLGTKATKVTVYGQRQASRVSGALAALIEQLMPDLRYYGSYEFRVVSQDENRLNLQPTRAVFGLPELTRVPVRYGVPGWKSTVEQGSLAVVTFVNADPSRPAVVGFDDPSSPGWIPASTTVSVSGALTVNTGDATVNASGDVDVTADGNAVVEATTIKLGAAAALAAARVTDPVIAGAFAGTITGPGSTKTSIE